MSYRASKKLKRERNQRRALFKTLLASLVLKKRIKTTEAKAKAVRPFVERLVTVAKKDTLSSRRYVAKYVSNTVAKGLHTLAATYKERPGGYLRIVKAGMRHGDKAKVAFIEFV